MRSDTTPAGMRDLPRIWQDTRARIAKLIGELPEEDADTAVSTVPGATVRDVVSHLVETASRVGEAGWVASAWRFALPQRCSTRSPTLVKALALWEQAADAIDSRVLEDPAVASVLITDAVMCEHDIRTALRVAGFRDDVAIKVALDELSGRFSDRVDQEALPALRVTVEQWGTIAGSGRATSCVVADRFEFVRAMSGRRSAAEIRRWNWGVEPDIYLAAISEVDVPVEEVHERDPRIPESMRDREFVL